MTRGRGALLPAPRRLSHALVGAALAFGAPLGLLAVRLGLSGLSMEAVRAQLQADHGTYVYVAVSTALVFTSFGYVLGRRADALVALSRTDPLTRLGNLLKFEDRLELEGSRAARYHEPLSLLLLDVDRLKTINDRHGHRAGNRALQAVARALRSGARAADLAARVGGDEFALLAPNTPAPAAASLGDRIRAAVADEGVYGLTVSVGVATLEGARASDAGLLWDRADASLYEAKRQGRNRVVAV